jgi:hypothetical protein
LLVCERRNDRSGSSWDFILEVAIDQDGRSRRRKERKLWFWARSRSRSALVKVPPVL